MIKYFGDIINGKMELNWKGRIVEDSLKSIIKCFKNFKIIEYIIMPDHIHLLIQIKIQKDSIDIRRDGIAKLCCPYRAEKNECRAEDKENKEDKKDKKDKKNKSRSISIFIQSFKSNVSKKIRLKCSDFEWQGRFYDHIIRDRESLMNHIQYIIDNPKNYS
jgi:REP element-mobilizing transposase RayT